MRDKMDRINGKKVLISRTKNESKGVGLFLYLGLKKFLYLRLTLHINLTSIGN